MRRPGFTLIETLIALLILVVVLGGSLTASRALSKQTRVTTDQTEMAKLADESLGALQTMRATDPGNFGATVGLAANASAPVSGAAIAAASAPYVSASWCGSSCASALLVPVCQLHSSCRLSTQLSDKGEVVAVSRTDPAGGVCGTAAVVDLLSKLPVTCQVDPSDTSNWSFYARSVSVSRVSTGDTAVDPSQYHVKITVTSVADPTDTLVRDSVISDYANASTAL